MIVSCTDRPTDTIIVLWKIIDTTRFLGYPERTSKYCNHQAPKFGCRSIDQSNLIMYEFAEVVFGRRPSTLSRYRKVQAESGPNLSSPFEHVHVWNCLYESKHTACISVEIIKKIYRLISTKHALRPTTYQEYGSVVWVSVVGPLSHFCSVLDIQILAAAASYGPRRRITK